MRFEHAVTHFRGASGLVEAYLMLVWGVVALAVFVAGSIWDEMKGSVKK